MILAPIYAAGEQPVPGLSSRTLAERIQTRKPELPIAVADDLDQVVALVKDLSLEADLVLAMGAGDINSLWSRLAS